MLLVFFLEIPKSMLINFSFNKGNEWGEKKKSPLNLQNWLVTDSYLCSVTLTKSFEAKNKWMEKLLNF